MGQYSRPPLATAGLLVKALLSILRLKRDLLLLLSWILPLTVLFIIIIMALDIECRLCKAGTVKI